MSLLAGLVYGKIVAVCASFLKDDSYYKIFSNEDLKQVIDEYTVCE